MTQDDRETGNRSVSAARPFLLDSAADAAPVPSSGIEHHDVNLHIASWWLKARRLRDGIFRPGLFADPAWDILLDLYTSEAKGKNVQVSSLAIAARVPHSTAIRWARIMTREGLLEREKDPRDGRRIHIRLSPLARQLIEEFFDRLGRQGSVPSPILTEPAR